MARSDGDGMASAGPKSRIFGCRTPYTAQACRLECENTRVVLRSTPYVRSTNTTQTKQNKTPDAARSAGGQPKGGERLATRERKQNEGFRFWHLAPLTGHNKYSQDPQLRCPAPLTRTIDSAAVIGSGSSGCRRDSLPGSSTSAEHLLHVPHLGCN